MNEVKLFKVIEDNVIEALEYLISRGRKELIDEGHYSTGALDRSFEPVVEKLVDDCYSGKIMTLEYGESLHTGIPASSVPFSGTGGDGTGRSEYIQGLIRHFQNKGDSLEDATDHAFATATKAKYITDGHPTQPYYENAKYSTNGRRTGWKDIAYSNTNLVEAERIMRFGEIVEALVVNLIQNTNAA